MTGSSSWFADPNVLTAEVKRAHSPRAAAPEITGYDDLRHLAQGGQGIVYRGVQRSTRRPVAVKVMTDGALASGSARRRFEREVDVVASLKHPNIVCVYDSGTTQDGRMYLVMEYIEGVPLDEAVRSDGASSPGLTLKQTLGLFANICDAVQYAHQHGVIHRDLKPGNIRVDPAGQPHILDFGLAKAAGVEAGMAGPRDARSVLSISGQFMGSLPWASPEQAAGNPDNIDVRTDVYSLGVILYQLLTGRFPYDVSSGLRPTLNNIVNAEPVRATSIRPELGDEVGTIVAKCLSKDPDRRYQSAGDLARDLRHYLAGEPIDAKRDSAWYTVRKQLRRYRLAAIAAAAFTVIVSGALVVSTIQYRDASRARDKATSEAARSTAVNDFLLETLAAADPDKSGPKTPVVELLDSAAAIVDTRFEGKDDVKEALHSTLRDTYTRLGEYAKAEIEARKVVDLRRRLRGEEDPSTLSAIGDLSLTISKQQRPAEVEGELRRVLELQRKKLGPYDDRTISTLTTLAQGLINQGKPAEAAKMYEEARDGVVGALGPDSDSAIIIVSNLAAAYEDLSRFPEAEKLYREAMERRLRVSGPQNSETLTVMNNLGTLLLRQNRLEEAQPLLKEQLYQCERRLGPDNISTLTAKNNYAKLLQDMGKLPEAETLMKETLEARTRVLGEDHAHTLVTMNNLGSLYALMKRYEDSEKVHRRALQLRRSKPNGEESIDTMISMNNLAGTLREQGKYEEALPLYTRAVEVTDHTLPAGHFLNALFRMNRGFILLKMGRYDEAETPLLVAHDALQKAVGPTHPQYRQCCKNLVTLYETWGKAEKADPFRADATPPAAAK